MISVCIATYNGEKYIREQLDSILAQIGNDDEIIISDDNSTDNTEKIIKLYNDRRIKIFANNKNLLDKNIKHHLVTKNFENALRHAKGDYIFLADQDDIWEKNKVSCMVNLLNTYELVMSDCKLINNNSEIIHNSFFQLKKSRRGILRNLIKSRYHGCCMAFTRKVLDIALPFPKHLVMHDAWLGLIAECFFPVLFFEKKLLLYRIHNQNVSSQLSKSSNTLYFKLIYRVYLAIQLLSRLLKYSIKMNKPVISKSS
jgi:glycosyltransferase involved in cell wall biosynthesis